MSKEQKIAVHLESAKAYVNRQLETMKQQGASSNLTPKQYETLVRKVALATSK